MAGVSRASGALNYNIQRNFGYNLKSQGAGPQTLVVVTRQIKYIGSGDRRKVGEARAELRGPFHCLLQDRCITELPLPKLRWLTRNTSILGKK